MKAKSWPGRYRATRISLYNHKGGVGKTTLTANIAAALGELGKRVLLVDADPQANLTSYFIESSVVDSLLDASDSPKGATIWSVVRPLVTADGDYNFVEPHETNQNNVWLVPGDIRLAEFEEFLHGAWTECFQRKLRGYKGVNGLAAYVDAVAQKIKADFVFYDAGPNIGALNRTLLLDSDYFVVPVACDLFSTRALKTLGHTLAVWVQQWQTIKQLAPDGIALIPGTPRYLGYIPQGFRTYRSNVAQPASKQLPKIEKTISADILNVLRKVEKDLAPAKTSSLLRLGQVPNFYKLVMTAQELGTNVWQATANGVAKEQKETAHKAFRQIAKAIVARTKSAR
jgi:cellulose biosynthesis protein BcsQ